ncbi:MAG: hypothetical protein ABJH08_02985 [Balneola sp.]
MTRKIFTASLFFILISSSLYSQNRQRQNRPTPPPIEERVETVMEKLKTDLQLKEDQIKASDEIFTEYFKSIDRLRSSGSRPDRNRIESIGKKRDKEFEALLDASQKKKYEKLKEDLFNRRRR